jgi:hypothetical protein
MKFCYSHDEELFHGEFELVEDALAEAFDDPDVETAWTGQGVPHKCGDFLSTCAIDNILESMAENAFEECGEEVTSGFLDGPKWAGTYKKGTPEREKAEKANELHKKKLEDLRDRLRETIDAWAEDYGEHPRFWGVENVKEWKREEVITLLGWEA